MQQNSIQQPHEKQAWPTNIVDPIGIGLRQAHYQAVLEHQPDVGWFEVHSENYFSPAGPNHFFLEKIRQNYPIALHGVGLSIGSSDPLSAEYLAGLKHLVERYNPCLVSDHISWSSLAGEYFPDLYPLPFTGEVIDHLVSRIQQVQELLQRPIVLENISSYACFRQSEMPEWEFINTLCERSGCKLLLDINNLFVNARNHGLDSRAFLDNINPAVVAEIHLSGACHKTIAGYDLWIDSHDQEVAEPVWQLFSQALIRLGSVPSLIEWDQHMPELELLLAQSRLARALMEVDDAARSTA